MDFFFNVSPVAKILFVFALILAASRVKVPLGISLILGGLAIDMWAGKTVAAVFTDFLGSLGKPELWLLVLNITLILEFGYFMAHKPNSQAVLTASRRLGGRHGRALSLVIMPAAMGLVPMPGGALFSAPLVGDTLGGKEVPSSWKVAVNYWFRHVFEYWWPLYPVVIVTLSIFSLDTWQFFSLQMPFTLVSLLSGWFFLLKRRLGVLSDEPQPENGGNKRLLTVLQPLIVVVACTLFLPGVMARLLPDGSATTHKLLAMLAGLVISLLLIVRAGRGDSELRLFGNLWSRKTANVIVTLGGVMVFQAMLEASQLLPEAGRQFSSSMVPIELVIAFLPFLSGLVTGIAIGFAGPSFPLVVGLIAVDPSISQASALVLAFSMGYAGMMLSPVHLCYILTRRYFSAGLFSSYVYLFPCVATVVGWGILVHVFLRFLGW
jgi:integral membrane protein (TIGR00529 family)